MSASCSFGGTSNFVAFQGERFFWPEYPQELQRIGVGGEVERITQQGLQKAWLSDWSGGIVAHAGIADWRQALNLVWRNEGCRTSSGLPTRPYLVTNQSSVTSDADISSVVAANGRSIEVKTSLGDTEERIYKTDGNTKIYRNVGNGNSAFEVCYTTTNKITAMAVLNVNGTPRLCFATNGATDDISYVADPTGTWSGNITVLVALSSGDWIEGMQYMGSLGPSGANLISGTVGGTAAKWWKDTSTAAAWTLEEEVVTSSKDQPGTGAITSTTIQFQAYVSTTLTNPQNLFASDNADATASSTGNVSFTVVNPDLSNLPRGVDITGMLFSIEAAVSSTAGNPRLSAVSVSIEGTALQTPPLPSDNTYSTSDEVYTAGLSTYALQHEWTRSELQRMAVTYSNAATATTPDWSFDHVFMTFYHRALGSSSGFPTGGYMVTPNAVFPFRQCFRIPATQDSAAVLTDPRHLWFVDHEWQADQERPTFTLSQPNEGMPYVWDCEPVQGGYAIAGGAKAGDRGTILKHLTPAAGSNRDGDQLRDFNFPAVHGSTPVKIVSMYGMGNSLMLGVMDTDLGDFQWWRWTAGRYHAETALQSLTSLAIAAEPIPLGTRAINTQDARICCMFPNGTDTAFRREFMPPDPTQDDRVVNTSEVRMNADSNNDGTGDRAFYLIGLEQNFGPEEAKKAVSVVQYGGRRISAATGASYGSVSLDLDTGGDTTFASAEVSNTFTSAFEVYNVPSSGVAYTSIIPRIGIFGDNGEADTPDGGPFLITTVQRWPHLRSFFITITQHDDGDDQLFIERCYDISEDKTTQPLIVGDRSYNTSFGGPVEIPPDAWPMLEERGVTRNPRALACVWHEKPGTV